MSLLITDEKIEITGEEKDILAEYELLGKEICDKLDYDYSKLLLMLMYRNKK